MVSAEYLIILTVVEVFIYIFHASVLLLLICKRKTSFKGPFYEVFRIVLFADLLTFLLVGSKLNIVATVSRFGSIIQTGRWVPLDGVFLNNNCVHSFRFQLVLAFRVPLLSEDFFKNDNYIPSADLLISAYFLVVEFIGHTLMAFNRFTLLWFPLKYERIWRRNWYTAALIILPFFHVCYRLTEHGKFAFSPGNTVAMVYTNPSMTSLIFLLSAAIFLTTTGIAAVFNVLALIKFYCYKQSTNNASMKERRLLCK